MFTWITYREIKLILRGNTVVDDHQLKQKDVGETRAQLPHSGEENRELPCTTH